MISEIIKIFMYLGTFIIVILLAFFFTKYVAKKSSLLSKSKNIKVIDGISLGKDTRIFIIEVLGAFYILYDNNTHVLLLERLSKEEVTAQSIDFEDEKNDINNIVEKLLSQKDNIFEKLSKEKKNKYH